MRLRDEETILQPVFHSAVMKTSPPALLYILSILMAFTDMSAPCRQPAPSGPSPDSSSLSCFYDSVEILSCTWTPMKNITEAQCQLEVRLESTSVRYKGPETCQLQGIDNRSCELNVLKFDMTITHAILVEVYCHTGQNWTWMQNQRMCPFQNLRLRSPCNVQMENDEKLSYNLTWKLCALSHYLENKVEYQIRYKKIDPSKAYIIGSNIQDQRWMKFETLSPDTMYEAAVRVKVKKSTALYNSTWSKWSMPVTWTTHKGDTSSPSLLLTVLLTLLGSLVFLFLFFIAIFLRGKSPASKRLRKVLKIHLPDPAEFFPSLTAVHGGDIQKWLSSPAPMSSFYLAAAVPDVSVLEVMQKGNQEPCLLLSKEHPTNTDAPETSGHSSSSCFTNRGYFFFHTDDSLEIEPCKVYFTYDPLTQEISGREDSDPDSYKVLHETWDNRSPPPAYSITADQKSESFLQEAKVPKQKVGGCPRTLPSAESFPVTSEVKEGENKEGSEAIVHPNKSPEKYSMDFSCVWEPSGSNTDGTEAIGRVDPSTGSVEDNGPAFPQPMIQNSGQANDLCRAASSSQVLSSSEAYLTLRDLQGHYGHHSV
ncbi:LOW QUALITY PROTEIN: interleukin-2 receptor subunit beta [Podarcis muralis]